MKCPVCESSFLYPFLRRRRIPVHQHLLLTDQSLAEGIARGNLQLFACRRCGFVFNAAFDLASLAYGPAYDNTQTYSSVFAEYVNGLVRDLIEEQAVRNCRIVEVGCGNGYFLRKLVGAPGAGNVGYGFDPSYVGPTVELDGRLQFATRFYDAESAATPADVVICRHVIEHVPEPLGLLRTIHGVLRRTSGARLFIETPSTEWILRHQVFWDFFYEHCSYFTVGSLTTALERAGLQVRSAERMFGGQYLWVEAIAGDPPGPLTFSSEVDVLVDQCRQFGAMSGGLRDLWRKELTAMARTGKVALWGAGAKGVTLANLVDPNRELIACVVDLNPHKIGAFIPGTGHPIVDYMTLPAYSVRTAVVMNPNYCTENSALLQDAGLDITLVDPSTWQRVAT